MTMHHRQLQARLTKQLLNVQAVFWKSSKTQVTCGVDTNGIPAAAST